MLKDCYVYCLKDTLQNEVRYIGITINLKNRLRDHLKPSKLKENHHKANWIKAVLAQNGKIYIEVIEKCSSWKEACSREVYYISKYKSLVNLTNLTKGGDGTVGVIPNKETRYKIGTANRGKDISKLYGDKISEGLKNAYKANKRSMSKDQQTKMIEKSRQKCSKIVFQYTKQGEFIKEWVSVTEASKFLKCAITTICDCANGKTKTAKNFIWKYKQ